MKNENNLDTVFTGSYHDLGAHFHIGDCNIVRKGFFRCKPRVAFRFRNDLGTQDLCRTFKTRATRFRHYRYEDYQSLDLFWANPQNQTGVTAIDAPTGRGKRIRAMMNGLLITDLYRFSSNSSVCANFVQAELALIDSATGEKAYYVHTVAADPVAINRAVILLPLETLLGI